MLTLATASARPAIRRGLFLMLLACAGSLHAAQTAPAAWFPDSPTFRHYVWQDTPCPGCEALVPLPVWSRMASLAGITKIHFRLAPDASGGEAYSVAPDVVVLSPSALKLKTCQLAFLVGHEIVHIAQRHFDEDAIALSVYSGKPADWTRQGSEAMELVDGDFGLALRVSHLWQDQEHEADWLGALLAAQACGCSIESSALAYFRQDTDAGGGIAAAHSASAERMRELIPFAESAERLATQATH
jgi:hypothetical protein